MALFLNRCTLVGSVGRDPEARHTQAGAKVVNFSVATNARWKDKSGALQEKTTWHNVTAWGQLADICEQVVHRGAKVLVEGPLEVETYQAKDGTQKTKTYIKADQVISMTSARDRVENGGQGRVYAPSPVTVRDQGPAWDETEMPF